MHVHILGICGTFMGGIAAIAREMGHTVTGSDRAVYPPMSDQLEALGIELTDGFDPAQLDPAPDVVVVGNVMRRGMPIVETLLNSRIPWCSGPQWLAEHVLKDRWVIAVSGTHGKTTTSSLTAWLLEHAGTNPGFLIGGIPGNFDRSARLGSGPYFVIEADEYDTAFFDKRAKFMHYGPRTLVINNIEFDHADIYADLDAILWQFHQMLRILPGDGGVIANGADENVARLLEQGCWSGVETFSSRSDAAADWTASPLAEGEGFQLYHSGAHYSSCEWHFSGGYNRENALAALLAVRHAGQDLDRAIDGLAEFKGVKRRQELLGTFAGVELYDDFAHHPTAIARMLAGMREARRDGRIIAVLEPRSNSMKLGAHRDGIPDAVAEADLAWVLQPEGLGWSVAELLEGTANARAEDSVEAIVAGVAAEARPGDAVLVMSNGAFGGIHGLLRDALNARG